MRILGIDLGTTSIKAVELDSGFGRYEIRDYYEAAVEPGTNPALALARLVQGLPKAPDRVAIALPTGQVTFRNLKLPTRDRKAIQAGVGFELDDELPFGLDRAIYSYATTAQTKAGTELHVAATLRKHIEAGLAAWREAGVDPDMVTTESWAFRTHLNRVLKPHEQEEPVLLCQVGHERTLLYVQWKGAPVLAREIPWGGRDLTLAISQKYGIPLGQAETAKLDHGFVIAPSQRGEVTPEQLEFSEMLMEPVRFLISEIRQAEFTCKNLTHRTLSTIFLSGGTTMLPGLARVIEELAFVKSRALPALSSVTPSGVTYSEHTDAVFLPAAAAALTLVGSERDGTINLRRGDFAKQGRSREINLATLKRPLLAAGAVAASLFLSLFVESWIYKNKSAETDAQLERALKGFFGQVSSSAIRSYLNNTKLLRDNIQKELKKQRELANLVGANPHSPLDFLRNLSASIPKDVVVDETLYQVGAAPTSTYSPDAATTASLTFIVANPAVADRLKGILGAKMSGIQAGKPEELKTPEGIRYRVTFTGNPTEAGYGK